MSPETLLFMAIGLVVLAIVSAFVSAVETALFSFQPQQIEAMKARGSSFADALAKLMENPRRVLSAILLADAFANAPLMIGSLALIERQNIFQIPRLAAVFIIFALIVFVCDLVPKLFALGAPKTMARLGVAVLRVGMPVLDPLAHVLQSASEKIANLLLPTSLKTQRQLSEEEMETLVELSAETGALHETESEMISEIIKLGDKTAKDCMTPRVDMFALPDDLTNDEAIAQLRQRRFRRVPVYGATPDDIEGVLDVAAFLREPGIPYTERLDVPSFVPETMKAMALLKSFLSHPQGLAIVVDEHGGVEGMVTMADLVEEIISDAVPQADAKLYLEPVGESRLLASGHARLEDIAEELGVSLEEEGVDTIGGLAFIKAGQLPRAGQELQIGSVRVTVRRVSRKRVEEVLLERLSGPQEEES
jgi:CBS domain containing-hemolysin-like protein